MNYILELSMRLLLQVYNLFFLGQLKDGTLLSAECFKNLEAAFDCRERYIHVCLVPWESFQMKNKAT